MKAVAVFPGEKTIQLIEHEEPQLNSPNSVKVRMLEVGICGTDREIVTFQYGTPPPGAAFLILGHESLGEVTQVGEKVTRIKPGDLVVTMVRRPCPHESCMACRAGRPDFCYTGDFTERGIKQEHGFMAEWVVDDESYMHVLPQELREVGVLTEPLTIAEKGMIQAWEIQQRLPWACPVDLSQSGQQATPEHHEPSQSQQARGSCHRALVLGAGPVGLLGAMVLRLAGFETFVYSREDPASRKADLVRSIGGEFVSGSQEKPGDLAQRLGNIDLVYEATGASALSFEVLQQLGTNGVFIFTGVPGRKAPLPLHADQIMRNMVLNNQIIYGTVNAGRAAFEQAITDLGAFMKSWPEALHALITQRYPLEKFQTPLFDPPEGIKQVISIANA